jgi:hypothetical protein
MEYDKENDRIISSVGSEILVYPIGPTFPTASEIEIDIGADSINVPIENLRELIDGLTQAATRVGV